MTNPIADPGHGHSPAAWTAVIIMLVAVIVGTIAFTQHESWLVFASAGLLILGWITGGVLSKLGYGARGPKYTPKGH